MESCIMISKMVSVRLIIRWGTENGNSSDQTHVCTFSNKSVTFAFLSWSMETNSYF